MTNQSLSLELLDPTILDTFGPIDLVVIQATSFCNLDCDYCYLPDRQVKNQLSLSMLEPIFKNLLESRFLGPEFCVCWHAGEPLAAGRAFYEQALSQIKELEEKYNSKETVIKQSIQTNATLINDDWCDLFNKYQVDIGVSIDGPEFIHDIHRKTKKGLGTHAATMRGIEYLKKHDIDCRIIAVISQDSLDYPDEIFNFFMEHDLKDVGFNIEELEGVHTSSSLQRSGTQERFKNFMKRIWELNVSAKGEFRLREFERICQLIYCDQRVQYNQLTTPFAIINIDYQGNFSTFDPELLSIKTDLYGDFILGNVVTDTFESVCQTPKFNQIYQDILAGVNLCKETCQYFGVCGGGAGSNKYWENGTFRSSLTMNCLYYQQIITDVILEGLESSLGVS